uniref:Uncharacterized protein n=1 Tax=Rhizophora mucronata TaxID=61149 RepID=A0A2P2P401_RHIMU
MNDDPILLLTRCISSRVSLLADLTKIITKKPKHLSAINCFVSTRFLHLLS